MARCLTTDQIIALHARAVRATGGRPEGFATATVWSRRRCAPGSLAHYADADIISQAAALATGLSRARAFVDGI